MTVIAHCRRFIADDAQQSDPTGTSEIRDAFAADLTARWALLRRLVQEAAPVISGAGKAAAGVAGWLGLDRAGPFREWLDVAMERTLLEGNGAWVNPYIQQAVEIAERRAVGIGGAPLGHSFTSDVITLQSVAVSELRGICAAVLQQATRQAAVMALGRASPEAITAAIFSRIDALGKSRSHQMAGYMVVKAHALATLASFRGAGVTHVGLVPENVPPEPAKPEPDRAKVATEVAAAATLASMAGLAATPTKPMARWEAAAMRRAAGEEEPAEGVMEAPHEVELRRLAAAAAGVTVARHVQPAEELAGLPWGEKPATTMVNVVTAGDDRVCPICAAISADSPYDIDTAMSLIPAHVNCLPGDSLVTSVSGVTAATKRLYEGDLVVIRTSAGRELSCTPNHPILTDSGWVGAQTLNLGDKVVCDGSAQWSPAIDADDEDVPTRIEQIADAFALSAETVRLKVPAAAPDFHGDGAGGDVDIVYRLRDLLARDDAAGSEQIDKGRFKIGRSFTRALDTLGARKKFCHWGGAAARRVVSALNLLRSLCRRHLGPFEGFGLALASGDDAALRQDAPYDVSAKFEFERNGEFGSACRVCGHDLGRSPAQDGGLGFVGVPERETDEFSRDAILALKIRSGQAGPVFEDEVVYLGRRKFSGHVFNLQTVGGYYTANGIVTHNCRCVFVPVNGSGEGGLASLSSSNK